MSRPPISFIMPAYNCAETIEASIASIMNGNYNNADELIIVDDCSFDGTENFLQAAWANGTYKNFSLEDHDFNRGSGAACNTAIHASRHDLIFRLDSDNLLVAGSIDLLVNELQFLKADAVSFGRILFFRSDPYTFDKEWRLPTGRLTLADYLSQSKTPGATQQYLFTKESWKRAGGYPEHVKAMEGFGFGLRQLMTGTVFFVSPNSFYYHRYGHKSYWVRSFKDENQSLYGLQLLVPYLDRLNEKDVAYLFSEKGRISWYQNLDQRPLHLKETGLFAWLKERVRMNGIGVK